MHLLHTHVAHEATSWRVDFLGDNGQEVSIRIADSIAATYIEALDQARELMVQLTPYGTRGGGGPLNFYDAASNGNFDGEESQLKN